MSQAGFTDALLRPNAAVPEGLVGPTGAGAGKRFNVYRNNVAVSLTEALETAFPVIRKLVGDAFFKAMAGVYLRQHPPSSPLIMFYGREMPDFLAGFEPVAHLGYLPDVARLELALRESYHAADARAVDPAELQQVAADDLPGLRFRFAPALRLIPSRFPLHGIWAANMRPGAPAPGKTPEWMLVTRPDFDPQPEPLTPQAGAFIAALRDGTALGLACEAAGDDFDPGPALGLLLSRNTITELLQ